MFEFSYVNAVLNGINRNIQLAISFDCSKRFEEPFFEQILCERVSRG
jgi:hypothetical protein